MRRILGIVLGVGMWAIAAPAQADAMRDLTGKLFVDGFKYGEKVDVVYFSQFNTTKQRSDNCGRVTVQIKTDVASAEVTEILIDKIPVPIVSLPTELKGTCLGGVIQRDIQIDGHTYKTPSGEIVITTNKRGAETEIFYSGVYYRRLVKVSSKCGFVRLSSNSQYRLSGGVRINGGPRINFYDAREGKAWQCKKGVLVKP